MEKKGLIIGIDYAGKYCQASYYSRRHGRPESIAYSNETMRYLIPTALCYQIETGEWLIGQPAIDYAERSGCTLYREFLDHIFLGGICTINGEEYSYTQLLAIFFGKIIELMQLTTSVMGVDNITINLRHVTMEIKEAIRDVFRYLKLPQDKIRLLTCAESFAYYVLNENPSLWEKGAVLFDFSAAGFYEKVLTVTKSGKEEMIYISERTHTSDFSMADLGNEVLRGQMDERLESLYREIASESRLSSVFFTGEGFSELWFDRTLKTVSEHNRAFRGNNLFVKGACLAGYLRSENRQNEYAIVCAGRTKCTISVEVRHQGEPIILNLSRAPKEWYDAGMEMDFILDHPKTIRFFITSLIENRRDYVDADLSVFPERPQKATRIRMELKFFNEHQCEIRIHDLGFGELFPASGQVVTVPIDLTGYI